MNNNFSNKVLITGVAGFIGSEIAKKFVNEGFEVFGIDDLSNGKEKNIPKEVNFYEKNVSKIESINDLPNDLNLILHLAGQSSGEISFEDPILDLEKNTISTLSLIDFAQNKNCKKIIYASSMSVYGNVENKPVNENTNTKPLSCYGIGKLASENYLKVFSDKTSYVNMRMFNVYGPGQDLSNLKQGMVSIYLAQAMKNKKINVKGSLNRFRDFIYIDDVVECWFKASLDNSIQNDTFNIGTGIKTTVNEILDKICNIVPGAYYTISNSTPGDQDGIYADTNKLEKSFSKKEFTTLDNGLDKFKKFLE